MSKKGFSTALFLLLLLAVILTPHLLGINQFVTGDEPVWVIHASDFLHALSKGEFEGTIYEYHPAVTTMWVIMASILTYFPGYIHVGDQYIEKFWELDEIYLNAGKSLSTVLFRGQAINAIVVSVGLLIAFYLLRRLLGTRYALVISLFLLFDPFFLGQSRLLNHEGMAATFALVSILSILVYLNKGYKTGFLLTSAGSGTLALLSKSPMILLIPLTGLIYLVHLVESVKDDQPRKQVLWRHSRDFLIWLGILVGLFFLLWPAMWVIPGQVLIDVYGTAVSYAFQGSRLGVAQELNPSRFGLDTSGIRFFIQSILYKTTPVVWVGAILSLIGLFSRKTAPMTKIAKQMVFYFAILAVLFVLIFGVAKGKNSLHYIMSSFVALNVMAGIGFTWGITWLGAKYPRIATTGSSVLILGGIVLLHAASGLPAYPYYFTYTNPIMQSLQPGTQDPSAGYGEGLNLAAAYLAQKEGAEKMIVAAHLGWGPFSYYFPGKTYPLLYSSKDYLNERSANWVREADYLVIYDIQQKPMDIPSVLLAALEDIEPEQVIQMNGLRYASIYRVSELPPRVLETLEEPP